MERLIRNCRIPYYKDSYITIGAEVGFKCLITATREFHLSHEIVLETINKTPG